jgi:predicted transcriptional regulator
VLIRQAMEGENVGKFMNDKPVTVSSGTTIEQLIDDYIYRYHFKMFPVVDDDRLLGCITIQQVKNVPRDQRHEKTVADLMSDCGPNNTINAGDDAMQALSRMRQTGASRLMVVDDQKQLVGIIALKDLLKFLSLKMELEEGSEE